MEDSEQPGVEAPESTAAATAVAASTRADGRLPARLAAAGNGVARATRAGRANRAVRAARAAAPIVRPVVGRVIEPLVDRVAIPLAGHARSAARTAFDGAGHALTGRDRRIARRLRRLAREPLTNLFEAHPEAREATPRDLGLRFVPLEEIRGTAVAGAAQRGGDFLPLPPFRGRNWQSRWQRIVNANAQLRPLPPVDLVKYDGVYWVVDGHNRVAAGLYDSAAGLDAVVTELVPLGGHASEAPSGVLALRADADALRNAVLEDAAAGGVQPPDEPAAESETPPAAR